MYASTCILSKRGESIKRERSLGFFSGIALKLLCMHIIQCRGMFLPVCQNAGNRTDSLFLLEVHVDGWLVGRIGDGWMNSFGGTVPLQHVMRNGRRVVRETS